MQGDNRGAPSRTDPREAYAARDPREPRATRRMGERDGAGAGGARSSRRERPEAGALWRNLTDSMLAVSRRMPGIGRASAAWQDRRAADRGWDEAEQSERGGLWGDEPGMPPGLGDTPGMDGPLPSELWEQQAGKNQAKRGLLSRHVSYRVLVVLLLLSLFVGFSATDSVLNVFDALAAAKDAKAQVALVEAELKGGDVTSTDHLVYVQTHLTILGQDVTRIQGDIPLEPLVAHAPGGSGAVHVLTMAQDMVQAGQSGISAALILIPSLKGLLHGIGDSSTASTTTAKQPPAITAAQIQQAATEVDTASTLVQAALQERQQVSDGDLSAIGLGTLIPTLHKLDALTPKMGEYLGAAHTLMSSLPSLLGISKPINYMLFNMDSDELRATGGFMGNYAMLTLSGGRLQGGVHLRDIRLLDCPPDGLDSHCFLNTIPPQYKWFTLSGLNGNVFDVRDSNVDPDFPTSAQRALQYAHDVDGAPAANGVIAITPAVIEDILQVTGALKVDPYGVSVNATNLQDEIHYYHILSEYCQPNAGHTYDSQCIALAKAASAQSGTSGRKVFDAALGSLVLHTVGSLPPDKQSAVFKVILGALQTKDLQVYFTDPQMENVLTQLKVDSSVNAPQGTDSVFVADTNIGATYVSGDIQEQLADSVSLDAQGTATHHLTITYKYPVVNHPWNNLYEIQAGHFVLDDVVRVIVPNNAKLVTPTGCDPVAGPEANHQTLACRFVLARANSPCDVGGCSQVPEYQGTATLRFQWSVPNAAQSSDGGTQYSLQIQKQAGTHDTVNITIAPPSQRSITSLAPTPDPTPTPGAIGGSVSKDGAQFSGQLTKNITLSVSY